MLVNAESTARMPKSGAADKKVTNSPEYAQPRSDHCGNSRGTEMSTTIEASPEQRITAAVRRLLADRGITRPFTAQDDLREVGLTSLDMVNLVLAVEAELAVSIPEAEITPANFRSVATIDTLVASMRHRSAA
jgi:acyl carrier protein